MRYFLALLLAGSTMIATVVLIYWSWNDDYISHLRFWPPGLFSTQEHKCGTENKEPTDSSQDCIWFLETSYKSALNARQACSIESACRHNPDYLVHLLSTGNISSHDCQYHRLLSKLPNFRSWGLNASAELGETPLAPLYAEGGALHQSPYVVAHLSDFLRYVVLWKRGGVYLDTDVIVTSSLRGIRNSLFYQSRIEEEPVANGILFFDKQHPVLRALIDKCASVYSPQNWTSCGPAIVSPLASDAQFSHCLKFFNESAFFAVPFRNWENLFNPEMTQAVMSATNSSYGVHFWNALSKDAPVVPGSGSAMDVLAQGHCPDVYRLASSEGYL